MTGVSIFAMGDPAELEIEVDRVIADCDGDARAAVRALIVHNAHLEAGLEAQRREIAGALAMLREQPVLKRPSTVPR